MLRNAKIFFCLQARDTKEKRGAVVKPAIEAKSDSSLYSNITNAVYNISNNITGWFSGGKGGKDEKDEKIEKSEKGEKNKNDQKGL